jgi:hypothetical protein
MLHFALLELRDLLLLPPVLETLSIHKLKY